MVNTAMNSSSDGKIYILLDRPQKHNEALTMAASLAKQMKTPLQGLFIEDNALICAAQLPFIHEISITSARERSITTESTERMFRAYARQIKKEVESAAENEQIEWAFQTIRSERFSWILSSRASTDILFLGRENHKSGGSARSLRPVMQPASIKLLFTGSKRSQKALDTAQRIAEKTRRPLQILTTEAESFKPAKTQNPASASTIITRIANDPVSWLTAISRQRAYMAVIPGDTELINDERKFKQLLELTKTPLVIV